jgi:AraC family transcriptional regulator, regulatory protein of adaptative response / methylated-DNA-[protein]-cysteine methyltransferase
MIDFEECWLAVTRRENGPFVYGVMTTGVYCRPSCGSRMPLRKNVRFYETAAEAERDGLRACRRCLPDGKDRVAEMCRFIEAHADRPPDLAELASRAGLSRFHVQRAFRAAMGVTPKEYAEAFRVRLLKRTLRDAGDVTEAVYEAGFGSSSRVYERADTRLGMTPAQYRKSGQGISITYASAVSPVGLLMIGATDRGLCFVQFGESEEELSAALRREYPAAQIAPMGSPGPAEFDGWMAALMRHLEGAQPRLDLPLDVRATAFQMRVWKYLQTIPPGEVQSYGEVAAAIGAPRAVRAVARACASNTVAVAIPCHRVIRGTGELGGYRWGLERKRALIDRERGMRAGK